ncbi:MAG: hypothetical protein KDD35_07805 [Bdellovibrionales bacterium]|nr:hypothetical protein [Bdellovibrionales bacterium]
MKASFKKQMRLLSVIAAVSAAMVFIGHGCSNFSGSKSSKGDQANGPIVDEAQDFDIIPGERTVSTVYAKQVLDNMTSCSGIGTPSVATIQEWNQRFGTLSEYGYATSVSGPMLMGIVAIAGEVCNDLINQESMKPDSERLIFDGVDFTQGPASLSNSTLRLVTNRIARSCWQREDDPNPGPEGQTSETDIIANGYSDIINAGTSDTPVQQTRNGMLAICTGMLSSLSAIEL